MNGMRTNGDAGRGAACCAFGPWVLLAVSLILVLGWNTRLAWRQHQVGVALLAQHTVALQQAAAAEQRLQALLAELVTLAQTDPQARTITEKYQIRYSQPQARPAPTPAGP